MMECDFSRLNLQYLIHARDLARQDPERCAVLLGISQKLANLLSEVTPESLAQFVDIKPPLFAPRQGSWWWSRLFKAMHEGQPSEINVVLEHLSLVNAPMMEEQTDAIRNP